MNKVGNIKFGEFILPVYESLDEPIFKIADVMAILGVEECLIDFDAIGLIEHDEIVDGNMEYITEHGLYDLLAQGDSNICRAWRRIIFNELINLRKEKHFTIEDQFKEWDHALDDIYFDPGTGRMMQSVTLPGGDVKQIPYESEEES